MKLLSVNVGSPREIEWHGKLVRTSIFKSPVSGRIGVTRLNLEGDEQSDLSVHGGDDKAVYVYPSEHYPFWRKELPGVDLPWAAFGENFTTSGLREEAVHIGDRFRIGSALFLVTQPRMPCFKLGIRLGRPDMVKRFLRSGRTGFYLAVLEEGQVTVGDPIERLGPNDQNEGGITVSDLVNSYGADTMDEDLRRRISRLPALPPFWRDHFEHLLNRDS